MTVKNTKNVKKSIVNEFPCDLMERTDDGMGVVVIGNHDYYNLDGKVKMSEWMRGNLPKTFKTIGTTNGIDVTKDTGLRGTTCLNSLGYLLVNTNSVLMNAQEVALFSLPFRRANGFNLLPENFDRAVSGFAARKLVENQWYNTRDCYMKPNVDHPKYAEWQKDCYIFSMLHSASNQTSIKGEVDGEAYDFVNQFYPFTKEETYKLLTLTPKANFKDESRYIRSSGKLDNLTAEGQAVLDAFRKCMAASASARPQYDKDHEELQVTRWDCGWRQLKKLFEEACPAEFAELKDKFKALKEKMLPMVYELGFLKK